jgi:hypothetical protein
MSVTTVRTFSSFFIVFHQSNADPLQPLDHSIVKTAAGTTPSSRSFYLSSSSSSDSNSDMAETDLLRSDRLPFPGWFSDAEHSASRPGTEHDNVLTVATTAVVGIPRVAVAKELTEADAGQCRFKKDRVPETKPTSHADAVAVHGEADEHSRV